MYCTHQCTDNIDSDKNSRLRKHSRDFCSKKNHRSTDKITNESYD